MAMPCWGILGAEGGEGAWPLQSMSLCSHPCALCRGHCHENGLVVLWGALRQSRRAFAGTPVARRAHASHLSLQRVALSSPAGSRAMFSSSMCCAMPSSLQALPSLLASPSLLPLHPLGFGGPSVGLQSCGCQGREERPLQCLNEVEFFPHIPPSIHARKNYSCPGICSGRVELKSLSWAWQTSRRSRQLFQGQPWMWSSRLTLQGEEPCAAGTGAVPLSSCLDGFWQGVLQGGC